MFAPGSFFQPGLFWSYPQTLDVYRLVTAARDSHYSLNYGRIKFYNIEHWAQCYETFYVRNLRIFVISLSVRPW
jgi:hypothetical protein